ncbi:serine/threonine-protein kinase PLK4-like, partial [Saccoglossus kowalevskii]|uniref:Serine/threonine-protein kinase PLK4-like n=1 Tax=Saccoglossus kowalevskii TaxID=10224 RepID=A0ABM0MDT4_SACKO
VSILDGEVCLEFLKSREHQEKVVEVYKISDDGMQICIFHPNKGKGFPVKECPPSPSTNHPKSFSYHDLPSKYWKKYQYAVKFVQLVRTKTPKVTLYSKQAKCMLMENAPQADFEVCFYNGAKIHQTQGCVRIIEPTGVSYSLESIGGVQKLSPEIRSYLDHMYECHQCCLDLEAAITSLEQKTDQGPYFPIVVCRRPANCESKTPERSQPHDQQQQGQLVQHRPTEQDLSPAMPKMPISTSPSVMAPRVSPTSLLSYDGTVYSTRTDMTMTAQDNRTNLDQRNAFKNKDMEDGKRTRRRPGSSPKTNSNVVKSVFVPNIGWASQMSTGEVWVQYNDGSQINVQVSNSMVKFVDSKGNIFRYNQHDRIPEFVKEKLSKLPSIVEMFVTNTHA